VGKSLAGDPVLLQLAPTPIGGTSRQAIMDLRRLIDERTFTHSGAGSLTAQILPIRTTPGADGPRLKSNVRMDGAKALSWAIEKARATAEQPGIF
jgi:hypothetical protein